MPFPCTFFIVVHVVGNLHTNQTTSSGTVISLFVCTVHALAVECVTAHLRGFEEDSRSEVVFWIDEWSIEFGYHWLMLLMFLTADLFQSGRRCGHILASSVLQYRHFRVPAFDRRGTFVDYLAAALRKIQHRATVDRVTADCTMMFELWRASWTSTPILISLTPLTLCRLPWHFIAWCGAGIPTVLVLQHRATAVQPSNRR